MNHTLIVVTGVMLEILSVTSKATIAAFDEEMSVSCRFCCLVVAYTGANAVGARENPKFQRNEQR